MNSSEVLTSPVGFPRGVLQVDPYAWQESILWDLDEPGGIAVRAANGVGKTTGIAAPAALWNAAVFAHSLTILTSGVFRQVKEQLFPAIRQHASKFCGWTFNETDVEAPNGSRIIGFSTDEPGRFEGWHNENLMVIVDEAKTVPDSIFEAIERCQPKRLLLLSSPGGCSGSFYEAFHSRRRFFRQHTVTALECPHISEAWIQEQIEKYGEESPLVRSMIYGDFMKSGEDGAVIPLSIVERCLADPPEFIDDGETRAFCDFAAGGDENVFAVCQGNRAEIVSAWREKDTMRAVGRFIQLFKRHGLQRSEIVGDAGGLGIVMCDALKEAGWDIYRVNNGAPPRKSKCYASIGTEVWYTGRMLIEKRQIILPRDKALVGQLTSRLGWPNSRGKLDLESKPDMRSRGLRSPDRADAVLGAMFPNYVPKVWVRKLTGL